MPTKVVIIGGSVGGISTAVALRKAGCDVTVLERAASIVATTGAVSLLSSVLLPVVIRVSFTIGSEDLCVIGTWSGSKDLCSIDSPWAERHL